MRVIVFGGRTFGEHPINATEAQIAQAQRERKYLWDQLDDFHATYGITELCHGAATGADTHAGQWAQSARIPVKEFPADWNKYGKGAGPRRNKQMLDEFNPDAALGFPGGRGSANMKTQAEGRGVRVVLFNGP